MVCQFLKNYLYSFYLFLWHLDLFSYSTIGKQMAMCLYLEGPVFSQISDCLVTLEPPSLGHY